MSKPEQHPLLPLAPFMQGRDEPSAASGTG